MAKRERWIVIPKWDGPKGFQHYKDRAPKWIKNQSTLMAKDEYLGLTFHQRGVLHGLWLEYAASNRQLRDNTLTLTRRLGQRVSRRDLDALNHAGFLEYALAPRYHDASLEVEVDKEKKDLALNIKSKSAGEQFAERVVAQSTRERRPYDPPSNPVGHVRRLIGVTIHDEVDLEAEFRSGDIHLNDLEKQQLRDELRKQVA